MPRDANLYSPMSQALLRAARMGQVNKAAPPPLEDEKEPGEEEDAEGDIDTGFVAKRWAVVPKHLEGPEPEFLAKRRKGLPSVYSGATGVVGSTGQMRKTKVRKIDASGNVTVLDVLVPEGQTVEGEIVEEETASTEALAPGTVVDGVGVANAEGVVIAGDQVLPTPPRRRPPPPKRKPKGPGRGRKKKVGFVPVTAIQGLNRKPDSVTLGVGEDKIANGQGNAKEDVEMREDSVLQDGDDGGEDASEDDEEGEEGDDGDREVGELSPSPSSLSISPSKRPQPTPSAEPDGGAEALELDLTASAAPLQREPSSSPDLPLAAAGQGSIAPTIQVEPAENTVISLAPALDQIPASSAIAVEDLSSTDEPLVNTELPPDHNSLGGLAEPDVPKEVPSGEPMDEDVRFPSGEEDLLGSLERSLDKRNS